MSRGKKKGKAHRKTQRSTAIKKKEFIELNQEPKSTILKKVRWRWLIFYVALLIAIFVGIVFYVIDYRKQVRYRFDVYGHKLVTEVRVSMNGDGSNKNIKKSQHLETLYSGKISLSTRRMFVTDNPIDINISVKLINADFKNKVGNEDIYLFFPESMQHENDPQQSDYLKRFKEGGLLEFVDSSEKPGPIIRLTETGKVRLRRNVDDPGKYEGVGKIYYNNPGNHLLLFSVPGIKYTEKLEPRIEIGSSSELKNINLAEYGLIIGVILFLIGWSVKGIFKELRKEKMTTV